MSFRTVTIFILALTLPAPGWSSSYFNLLDFKKSTIEVVGRDKTYKFKVELALTPPQQSMGLMFRRFVAADAGMLFVYNRVSTVTMWMKNTLIPLDIIFIRSDGTIHRIAERTIPLSKTRIFSGMPVAAVLELNGGTVERLGIKVGDRVQGPALQAN